MGWQPTTHLELNRFWCAFDGRFMTMAPAASGGCLGWGTCPFPGLLRPALILIGDLPSFFIAVGELLVKSTATNESAQVFLRACFQTYQCRRTWGPSPLPVAPLAGELES